MFPFQSKAKLLEIQHSRVTDVFKFKAYKYFPKMNRISSKAFDLLGINH